MFAYLALLASASPTVQLPTLSKLAGRAVVSAPYPTAATNSDVPVIPNQFYATIYGNTTGTVPGVPYGQATVKQWYDYTNKRVREDRDDGTTKMYDYKTLVDPGNGRPPIDPVFPSPQGFKFQTNDIENTCCWVWLVDKDNNDEPETMEQFAVEKNAKLVGSDSRGDHWLSVTKFPFLQTDDWWFKNNTLAASNSYVHIPGHTSVSGYIMSNGTYSDVQYGAINASVFAHPDSRPTFGQCKQCGVDDECPMQLCMD